MGKRWKAGVSLVPALVAVSSLGICCSPWISNRASTTPTLSFGEEFAFGDATVSVVNTGFKGQCVDSQSGAGRGSHATAAVRVTCREDASQECYFKFSATLERPGDRAHYSAFAQTVRLQPGESDAIHFQADRCTGTSERMETVKLKFQEDPPDGTVYVQMVTFKSLPEEGDP